MVTTDNPRYKRNPVIPLSHHHYGLQLQSLCPDLCPVSLFAILAIDGAGAHLFPLKIDYAVKDPSPSMMTPTQAILIIC